MRSCVFKQGITVAHGIPREANSQQANTYIRKAIFTGMQSTRGTDIGALEALKNTSNPELWCHALPNWDYGKQMSHFRGLCQWRPAVIQALQFNNSQIWRPQ